MNKQRDLEGLTALVTGATSGIGREPRTRWAGTVPKSSWTGGTSPATLWSLMPSPPTGAARFAAAELSPAGVRVNTIAAGPVYTPIPANRASRNRQRHHHHGAGRPA
jgi:NAD(P)-dependent dehydrogenase (short-subunit alcohol dehydrogenase family)